MATPRPFFAGSSLPTVSTRSPLIFPQPQCDGQQLGFSIGAAPADRLGSTGRTPHHRRDHTGFRRKRLSSPHSGGPLVKRRVAEEQMVGDLQNLSLNVQDEPTSKSLAARWRELESRLSDPDSDSETASSTAADAGPRLVVTEELRSAMAGPASDFLPSRPDNSMAVVLWRPPPIQLPPDPSPPACPNPTSTSNPDGMEAAESPPPAAAAAAYDFSRFAAEEEERTTMAPDQRYHFRGRLGQAGAAPLFPGFGQSPVQMEDDELMEL